MTLMMKNVSKDEKLTAEEVEVVHYTFLVFCYILIFINLVIANEYIIYIYINCVYILGVKISPFIDVKGSMVRVVKMC